MNMNDMKTNTVPISTGTNAIIAPISLNTTNVSNNNQNNSNIQNINVENKYQDIQCFIETTINKLNAESAIYGTQPIYVPPPPSAIPIPAGSTHILVEPVTTPAIFDIEYSIPIIVQLFNDSKLVESKTTDVAQVQLATDYYETFNKKVSQISLDSLNQYIRTLVTSVRTKAEGKSIYFHPKYYDVNTATGSTLEERVLTRLREVVNDIAKNPSIPQHSTDTVQSTLINILVGLNVNATVTDNVKKFINDNNLILLSGATSTDINHISNTKTVNDNIFRGSISEEIQLDIFVDVLKKSNLKILKNPVKNLGIFYTNNDYGKRMLKSLQDRLKPINDIKVVDVP
jgi:hypothetical protein